MSAVGIIQHGHQCEGVPQEAVQLVDVLSGRWRLAQPQFLLDTTVIWQQGRELYCLTREASTGGDLEETGPPRGQVHPGDRSIQETGSPRGQVHPRDRRPDTNRAVKNVSDTCTAVLGRPPRRFYSGLQPTAHVSHTPLMMLTTTNDQQLNPLTATTNHYQPLPTVTSHYQPLPATN